MAIAMTKNITVRGLESTLFQKSDAKIQITITMAYSIRIK